MKYLILAIFFLFAACSEEHDYSGNWRVVEKNLIPEETNCKSSCGQGLESAKFYTISRVNKDFYRIYFLIAEENEKNLKDSFFDAKKEINWEKYYELGGRGIPYLTKISPTHYQALFFLQSPNFGSSLNCISGQNMMIDLNFIDKESAEGIIRTDLAYLSSCEEYKKSNLKEYGATHITAVYSIKLKKIAK
jgi:hypothetical protein